MGGREGQYRAVGDEGSAPAEGDDDNAEGPTGGRGPDEAAHDEPKVNEEVQHVRGHHLSPADKGTSGGLPRLHSSWRCGGGGGGAVAVAAAPPRDKAQG